MIKPKREKMNMKQANNRNMSCEKIIDLFQLIVFKKNNTPNKKPENIEINKDLKSTL